jgi:hypothetical protein
MVPLSLDAKLNFSKIVELDRIDGWIPSTFYPFAYDSGGNNYYWDSLNEEVYLVFDDDVDNPKRVCSSIDEFFSFMEKSVDA